MAHAAAEAVDLFVEVSKELSELQSGRSRPRTEVRDGSQGHYSVRIVVDRAQNEPPSRGSE